MVVRVFSIIFAPPDRLFEHYRRIAFDQFPNYMLSECLIAKYGVLCNNKPATKEQQLSGCRIWITDGNRNDQITV